MTILKFISSQSSQATENANPSRMIRVVQQFLESAIYDSHSWFASTGHMHAMSKAKFPIPEIQYPLYRIECLQHHSLTGVEGACTCTGHGILFSGKAAAEISWSFASSQASIAAASNPFPSPLGKELNLERPEDFKCYGRISSGWQAFACPFTSNQSLDSRHSSMWYFKCILVCPQCSSYDQLDLQAGST